MWVSIVGAKICYGDTEDDLEQYLQAAIQSNHLGAFVPVKGVEGVKMSDEQFVRFKNAGKRHASKQTGKKAGVVDRDRQDRTAIKTLHKWDVEQYGNLIGKAGPWGSGSRTNRDHMTADSSNQLR